MAKFIELDSHTRLIEDNEGSYIAQDANAWLEDVSKAEDNLSERMRKQTKLAELSDTSPQELRIPMHDRNHTNGHGSFMASNIEYQGSLGGGTPSNPIKVGKPKTL